MLSFLIWRNNYIVKTNAALSFLDVPFRASNAAAKKKTLVLDSTPRPSYPMNKGPIDDRASLISFILTSHNKREMLMRKEGTSLKANYRVIFER